jgi:hypothetical protein
VLLKLQDITYKEREVEKLCKIVLISQAMKTESLNKLKQIMKEIEEHNRLNLDRIALN